MLYRVDYQQTNMYEEYIEADSSLEASASFLEALNKDLYEPMEVELSMYEIEEVEHETGQHDRQKDTGLQTL